ncbi:MAG: adhesin [Lokiarchaeia virus VerdaV4]|uniref:Adhesin n=1 Tax=Lokiarchaeia virus VerdaV4 TaxID=3070172 RepID=A0AA35CPL5_9CAUD|nr:MAG: adhesin [Lokiarchaeia virus VerdaV4]BDI54974.1 MAG: adhesin [Lokiarchaeia virus VerdaV4]
MRVVVYKSNTYTFRYDLGKTGTNIGFVDVDNSVADAVPTGAIKERRTHILFLDHGTPLAGAKIDIEHTGFSMTTTGTIEFLIRYETDGPVGDLIITLYDGATRLVQFRFDPSTGPNFTDLDYDNGGGWTEIYGDCHANTWYSLKINTSIAAGVNGQFDCYLYNASYTELASVTGIEFENNSTTVDELHFETEPSTVNDYYLDCIGITGEGYIIGDIQNAELDVSDYMENTRIHDGIIPYKKFFYFDCHPKYEAYFNEGDFIDVWDVNDILSFTGYIKTKSQDKNGIYKITCHGMGNEVFERTYDKSFSSDNSKEKLQDLTTNALKFCFEGTYDTTTLDYTYEYNRACIYIFNLVRFMERQVPYIKPDGEIMVKDYNNLVKLSEYYLGTYNFRDETDGTSGADIDFVDTATLYNGACEIVSDWQGHKKVLKLTDDVTAGEDPYIVHYETQATAGTREFWVGTNDVTELWQFYFYEAGVNYIIRLQITASNLQYRDSLGAWQTIQAVANDILYHLKVVWRADNTFDVYVDSIKQVDNQATNNNQVSGIDRFYFRAYGDSTKYLYLDAYGDPDNDANYNVGDNLLAGWYLYDGNQNALLIDIPGLRDSVPGYYFGNTGITSVSVRYKDNTTVIRPATPTETFKKKRLKEFRDPKLQAVTEANQLGDNLYDIFSKDTIFLGMQIKGEGWFQPGKVIAIINTNQIAITAEAFLILKVVYDPKNDVHLNMILSNNIITPDEFKSDLDTSSQQVHTATLQSFENQANIANYTAVADLDMAGFNILNLGGIKTINDIERNTPNVDYTILKETLIQISGTFIFYWSHMVTSVGESVGYSKIYVNGAPVGVEKVAVDENWANVNDSIEVAAGDKIQVYGKKEVGGVTMHVKDFYVGTFGIPSGDY